MNKAQVYLDTYREYSWKIRGHLYANIANKEEADDVFQTIFCEFWNALDNFRNESTPATYLYKISRRKIIDHLRNKYKRARWLIPSIPEADLDAEVLKKKWDVDKGNALEILLAITTGDQKELLETVKKSKERQEKITSERAKMSVDSVDVLEKIKKIKKNPLMILLKLTPEGDQKDLLLAIKRTKKKERK